MPNHMLHELVLTTIESYDFNFAILFLKQIKKKSNIAFRTYSKYSESLCIYDFFFTHIYVA